MGDEHRYWCVVSMTRAPLRRDQKGGGKQQTPAPLWLWAFRKLARYQIIVLVTLLTVTWYLFPGTARRANPMFQAKGLNVNPPDPIAQIATAMVAGPSPSNSDGSRHETNLTNSPRRDGPTVLATCGVEQFGAALDELLSPGTGQPLLRWAGARSHVIERYRTVAEGRRCEPVPSLKWPRSRRRIGAVSGPLIINAGEGSTATRFLNCVMRRVGLAGAHTRGDRDLSTGMEKERDNRTEFMGCEHYRSCTDGWDRFSYISDSPVAYQISALIRSHPDALLIHSLRDPAAWKQSRLDKHAAQGAADWHQAAPCGEANHRMDHPLTELDYVVYNAWAHCIAPGSFPFNLWNQNATEILHAVTRLVFRSGLEIQLRYPGARPGASSQFVARDLDKVCTAEFRGENIWNATGRTVLRPGEEHKLFATESYCVKIKKQRHRDRDAPSLSRKPFLSDCTVPYDGVRFARGHLLNASFRDASKDVGRCCRTCRIVAGCAGWSMDLHRGLVMRPLAIYCVVHDQRLCHGHG